MRDKRFDDVVMRSSTLSQTETVPPRNTPARTVQNVYSSVCELNPTAHPRAFSLILLCLPWTWVTLACFVRCVTIGTVRIAIGRRLPFSIGQATFGRCFSDAKILSHQSCRNCVPKFSLKYFPCRFCFTCTPIVMYIFKYCLAMCRPLRLLMSRKMLVQAYF